MRSAEPPPDPPPNAPSQTLRPKRSVPNALSQTLCPKRSVPNALSQTLCPKRSVPNAPSQTLRPRPRPSSRRRQTTRPQRNPSTSKFSPQSQKPKQPHAPPTPFDRRPSTKRPSTNTPSTNTPSTNTPPRCQAASGQRANSSCAVPVNVPVTWPLPDVGSRLRWAGRTDHAVALFRTAELLTRVLVEPGWRATGKSDC
jgi:hypothetical protein